MSLFFEVGQVFVLILLKPRNFEKPVKLTYAVEQIVIFFESQNEKADECRDDGHCCFKSAVYLPSGAFH